MEWNISKSEHRCTACEKAFAEDDPYVSALFDQDELFVRRDYCPPCWETAEGRSGAFSFWRTRVPRRDEDRKPLVDESVVMDFFLRLADTEDEQRLNFRYILALMLMRKKKLKFVDARRRDDREYLVLRRPREEAQHEVFNPQLTDEQIEQVREDLSQLLETDV